MSGTNVVAFLSLVLLGSGLAEMDAETKEHITSGIEGGQGILDAVGTLGDPKTSKLFDNLERMSAFAGAAGGLISLALIFVPESDSEELKYMKEKFAEVNTKLDKITEELDDVKNLITFENQRSAYLSDASKVITGSEQLKHFLQDIIAVTCKTEKDCVRKRLRVAENYKKSLDIKQRLYTILKGTVKKTSVFGDPLLELLKTTYKCDVTKIDYFASGVLKLAFKGQQVILAHEKLTASKYSIVASMKDWLTMVYDLRSKTNEVKNDCYKDIKEYMKKDIADRIYQVNMKSNKDAVRSMKKKLDNKYPWVYWTIFAYGAYGGDQHWTSNKDGRFWNMPKNKNDRKRNIIAVAQDKGTYLKQRVEFAEALEKSVKDLNMDRQDENKADKVYDAVSTELKKNAVWGHIKTFTVLKKYSDFEYVTNDDHHLYWYNEELVFQICHGTNRNKRCHDSHARFIAVFRSQEEIDEIGCTQKCNGHGTCKTLPLTTNNYCECKPFYQGETCGSKTRVELAANAESILSMTFQIPKLTDIYFEIKDTRDFLGSSLNKVFSSVIALEKQIEKSFDDLEEKITQQFRWSGLLTQYSDVITNLKYYLHRFHDLPSDNEEKALSESRALASHILAVDGVEKWLFELNYLFVGRSDFSLGNHEPLMIVLMDHHKDTVCTKTYKDALDNAWRQLVLLQTHGFMMWIQALGIKDKSTDFVTEKFIKRSAEQIKMLDEATCNIKIAYSSNLQSCENGYYMHPGSVVENKCKKNYYVEGKLTTTCSSSSSKCRECKCNKKGSSSQECSDLTGTCTCDKDKFKGEKCYDRDCTWSKWGSWGACTKTCGYGGKETRKRKIAYKQAGSGKRCETFGYFSFLARYYFKFGLRLGYYSSRSCFKACCSGEFHCTKKKKCISSKEKCDYLDDCGDKQDEDSCEEKCTTKYTKYNKGGGGNAVYIDRHKLTCGKAGKLFKSFQMRRKGSKIGYEYGCCTLTSTGVCTLRKVVNSFTADGKGETVYLDRQKIKCGSYGFLNYFRLERNKSHTKWRYVYYCCDVKSQYRKKIKCYSSATKYTTESAKSYYLKKQAPTCKSRYFLNYFKLERNSGHTKWKYSFKCCRILP